MSLVPRRSLPAAVPARLRLLGGIEVSRRGRRNPPWAYAKLPAVLAVLGDAGHRDLRRDWIAALLWPDGDSSSLRRALYDLRRQLRHGEGGEGIIEGARETLRLPASVACDTDLLDAAWRLRDRPDTALAQQALDAWGGEFAAGLALPDCEEFELWLRQTRARWEQRGLELALALAEHHLKAGRAVDALAVARVAVEHVPEAEPARAILWRCLVAGGARLEAADDWRRHADLLAAQGLAPSAALRRQAGELGLLPAAPSAPTADDERALAEALGHALRGAGGDVDALLARAEARLRAPREGAPPSVLLLRRALMLRLMHAPWHDAMAPLAARAEALLCRPLGEADRLDLIQPLATWHGWMGRGMRGEVLLRGAAQVDDERLPAATRVRHAMTLALCHSCSTGDPERSIRAARRGLKIARAGAVPGCSGALEMLVANAALNRGAPGDAAVAQRALAQALSAGPLQHFDLVNHHQLSAQWQLQHGTLALALAEAEQGVRMADAVPFPLQRLSCTLLALAARLLMDEPPETLAVPLADAVHNARRIGSHGYLMNALFLQAALARRDGNPRRAASALDEAEAIARACGVQRIRKIPEVLLAEARGADADAPRRAAQTASVASSS